VVLVIDTSSCRSALALLGDDRRPMAEDMRDAGREQDLPERVRRLTAGTRLDAVLCSLGPGSFTGLRVGVSFGVGLALGLEVPLLGLGSLELQAARAPVPATALVEAGRGRLYWLAPGSRPRHGEPEDLPRDWPAVGWLRPATAEAVSRAGVRLLAEEEVAGLGAAAASLLGSARRLPCDTVKLEYMETVVRVRE
jgi:tRNA threonylcarbamoyl adenosine modification protein YeaZ